MNACIFAGKGSTNLKLREDQKRGRGVYIEGVNDHAITSKLPRRHNHTYKHRIENIDRPDDTSQSTHANTQQVREIEVKSEVSVLESLLRVKASAPRPPPK